MAEKRLVNRKSLGRQGEQLMNDNLFMAYNRIKYVGNGLNVPKQEYQTPILDYSLWVNRTTGSDVLNVYDESDKLWKPAFEGYYHPIDLRVQPMYPVNGQLFIDANGVLRYYEDKQWKVVAAASADDISSALMGITNFLIMPDMSVLTGTQRDYVVPASYIGKLFDNKKYIPKGEYLENDIRITYPRDGGSPEEKVSWVHVNPAYLYGVNKRLIKILDSVKMNNYFINVSSVNTEFYGFKNGYPVGTLLRNVQSYPLMEDISAENTDTVSDYRVVSGGIQLINEGRNYDFIYAITYKFDTVENSAGSVLTGSSIIGDNNQVFVGQLGGYPLVFIGGLYYECEQYVYDKQDGVITFYNEDLSFEYDPLTQTLTFHRADLVMENELMTLDNGEAPIVEVGAEADGDIMLASSEKYNAITGDLDLVVAAFADVVRYGLDKYPDTERHMRPPYEFDVTYEDVYENDYIFIQHDYIKQAAEFKHPIVFAQGIGTLYDKEYGITDEIELDPVAGQIKVFNYGPREANAGSRIKLVIADIGDAKLTNGYVTEDGKIYDDRITEDGQYLIFINGVCTSPSDHDVFEGYVELDHLLAGTQYFLMTLNQGDSGIDLLFDASIAYYTFRIEDLSEGSVYNDCDMVMTYITSEDDSVNGLLIDKTMMQKNTFGEEHHSTGEILYLRDSEDEGPERYIYKIFNVNGDYQWTPYEQEFGSAAERSLDSMLSQINGSGSVSIITNNLLKGHQVNYYAYTYADETDEPILKGTSGSYRYAAVKHKDDAEIPDPQDFYVRRTHYYSVKDKGILSTYVNGIQVRSYDSSNVDCKYHIPTHENISFVKTWGNKCDLYDLIKAVDENVSMAELLQMKDGRFSEELKNYSVTEELLEKLQSLNKVLVDMEAGTPVNYFVERIEQGEAFSADRVWCTAADRYTNFNNTYTSSTYIGPGNVDVYVNGVMLDRSSYSIFDGCNVILNELDIAGGSDEYDMKNPITHRLIKYYVTKYDPTTGKTVGQVKKVICDSPDEVMIEYKPDTSIRKTSYEIKEVTYDTGVLSYDDYEFPNSLINTKDEIKIWIDGILYTGGYTIKKKDIILKNNPLQIDPIKLYFDSHPEIYKEWKKENGEYVYRKSRIIFEWR